MGKISPKNAWKTLVKIKGPLMEIRHTQINSRKLIFANSLKGNLWEVKNRKLRIIKNFG